MSEAPATQAAFAGAFPPANAADWRRLVDRVLEGASFERLVSKTYDGLAIQPLYGRAAGASARSLRQADGPWEIVTRIDHPDPAEANALARADLESGADGLHLVFAGSVGACGFGIGDASAENIETLLNGIHLDAGIPLEIDLGPDATSAVAHIADLLERRRVDPSTVAIRLGIDPLSARAARGATEAGWPDLAPRFASLVARLRARGLGGRLCVADGRAVHAAGGSEAQELAFAIAAALAYWRAMEAHGIDADAARDLIGFRLAADADQLMTIAKLRALRRLWAQIETACGLEPRPIRIHAETAWRMMTRRDPWTNLLRTTVAALAAGIAGADAITVQPFTQALGLPDAFARRLARNTQLILIEEANLARVADPAAGSGAAESLTLALGNAAWALVQETERAGGLWGALQSGVFQSRVEVTRVARQDNVARRIESLVGTSAFVDLDEASVSVTMPFGAAPAPAPGADRITFRALPPIRLAEPFETCRDFSDAWAARFGARPKMLLVDLGRAGDFASRDAFARGLFEAGGFAVTSSAAAGPIDAAVDVHRASGAALVCLCPSDAIDAEAATGTAKALRAAGAAAVFMAGKPGDDAAALRSAGITGFVHVGCDAVAVLRSAQEVLALKQGGSRSANDVSAATEPHASRP